MAKGGKLNAKQQRFVAEYLTDLNATQAAIRAGYSAKTANVIGPRLLVNVRVAEAIEAGKAKRLEGSEFTQAEVLEELKYLAFSNHLHFTVDDKGNLALADGAPKGAHKAISSVKYRIRTDPQGNTTREVEYKLWDKPSTLKLAGRHLGLFPDRIERTPEDVGREPTVIVLNGELPPSVDDQSGTMTTTLPGLPGN